MNGVYRVSRLPSEAMPVLDGRLLGDKSSLLAAVGHALRFPDYYGGNWDALDECLADLSWHEGAVNLLITHADAIPGDLLAMLIEAFTDAAGIWLESGRPFALYLHVA